MAKIGYQTNDRQKLKRADRGVELIRLLFFEGYPIFSIDPERTLLDGLSMPQYCGDFAEVLHAFGVRAPHLNLELIINYASDCNSGKT